MASGQKIYDRNLELLGARCSPVSLQKIQQAPDAAAYRFDVVPGANDSGYDFIVEHSGTECHLHSRRDPVREAVRQVESGLAGNSAPGICVVAGIAGMYHLYEFAARLHRDTVMIVADVNPSMVRKTLSCCDLQPIIDKLPRTVFIVNDDVDTAKRDFRMLLKKIDNLAHITFLQPGLKRSFPREYAALIDELESEFKLEGSDRATKARLSAQWTINAVSALPVLLNNPDIKALKGAFSGMTGIVAAAGPTLNSSIELLKKLKGYCPVFAVGTALRPLLAAGIVPDFVIALDCDQKTLLQVSAADTDNSFLIGSAFIPGEFWNHFENRIFTYSMFPIKEFNQWMRHVANEPTIMNIGGTVSLTAVDAARYTGCDNILLLGLDLALNEDGTTHANNSMYGQSRLSREYQLFVKGNFSDRVPTTVQFAGYIKQISAYFTDITRSGEISLYNITTGGAFLDNTTVVKPDEFDIEKVTRSKSTMDFKSLIRQICDEAVKNRSSCAVDYIRRTIESLGEITRVATEAAVSGEDISAVMEKEIAFGLIACATQGRSKTVVSERKEYYTTVAVLAEKLGNILAGTAELL